jgi:hypothetical protein
MAEQKKRGFGALEDRIHELEDERKREAAPDDGRRERPRSEKDEKRGGAANKEP